tara:strand:- start:2849 stop:3427 length:579 start_codon:yes stop_codon:yes gene_type:complete
MNKAHDTVAHTSLQKLSALRRVRSNAQQNGNKIVITINSGTAKKNDVRKKVIARSLAPRLNAPSFSRVASPGAAAAPLVAAVATRAPLDDDIDVILTPDGRATVARVAGVAHTASETTTRFVDKIPFDARRVRLTSRAPRVGAAARAPRVDGMIRIASLASDAVVARACVTNASGTEDARAGHSCPSSFDQS